MSSRGAATGSTSKGPRNCGRSYDGSWEASKFRRTALRIDKKGGRGARVSRTVKIQDLEVKGGQKKRGNLSLSEKPAGPHQIPFTVVNGAGDGPTLLLNGGIDGSEYNGPAGTLRLQTELDPTEVKGTVIIVPVVNTPAFEAR